MKRSLGNFAILALVVLNLVIWLAFPPVDDGRENFARAWAGEILGSTVIILMACSLFLSTRPKWAEAFFGGLDKMYGAHRRAAVSAFLLLFLHVLIVPISAVWRLGNYMAMTAFLGIVTLALVTLAPRIPLLSRLTNASYDGWRRVHRFMGIFYALGFFHTFFVHSLSALVAFTWVQTVFLIGLASYLYTEFFSGLSKKRLPYVVDGVRRLNGNTAEVTLRPRSRGLLHRPGQFLFVRFDSDKTLAEPHPFTISSAPGEGTLRLTIKACGDWTRHLYQALAPGAGATVEGAYGLFDYKRGGQEQVWIAGGIGVTPFLSFLRDANGKLDRQVDFFYTVRTREEALFLDEIMAAGSSDPSFRPHTRFSLEDGALTVDEIRKQVGGDISQRHVYMCGPLGMVQPFAAQFRTLGIPAGHIHYEEFNFR
ncbi:MAG: ferric reductase-like transmembrane domain-containing protein [Chloroflexota bacterium]